MCHHGYHSRETLADEIARKLSEADEDAGTDEGTPSFLNEERDAEVDLLTDGGDARSSDDADA